MKNYCICGESFVRYEEAVQYVIDIAEYDFEEHLDETYGVIEICGITWYPSEMLRKEAPTVYFDELDKYTKNLIDEIKEGNDAS